MTPNSERILITCDADSTAMTWLEVNKVFGPLPPADWLDTGDAVQGSILIVDPELPFSDASEAIESYGSIFIRHMAPVQVEVPLEANESDLETFVQSLKPVMESFDSTKTFAVQSRILGEGRLPYRKVVTNETLSNHIERETGAVLDCKNPQQVISVLCTPTTGYLGLSAVEQNRSSWPGGMHRFKREEGQISRAEFKLLEALRIFPWALPSQGRALDLGASPGGWTRVLAEHGLSVDAVDPGDLDERLRRHPRVRHIRQRAQEFLRGTSLYQVIVNDMKMDARASVDIMLDAEPKLAPGGIALMTLKMPKADHTAKSGRAALGMIHLDLQRLATRYTILGARQLYHNRSEVTVALRSNR